jgi:hypothetical protein
MPKTLTVDGAIKNLMEASKPAPTEVVIKEPALKGLGQLVQFWLSVAVVFQLRTAIVWGVIAILAPQFGITWFMVMLGLYAIRHLVPTDLKAVVKGIAKR